MTVDGITEGLVSDGGKGHQGKWEGARPGQDGAGQREISSRDSEAWAVYNLWTVYFWNFPFQCFWAMGWLQVTEAADSETKGGGDD